MRFDHDLPASPRASRDLDPGLSGLLGLLSGLLLLAVLSPVASGMGIIYVDAAAPIGGAGTSWSDAFPDLQAALTAAAQGQGPEIWIAGGTYKTDPAGTDITKSFDLPSGVVLRGGFSGTESAATDRESTGVETVLSGDLLGDDNGLSFTMVDNARHVMRISGASGVTLDGLTIASGNSPDGGGGIRVESSTVSLLSCRITGNRGYYSAASTEDARGGGILVVGSDVDAKNCSFDDNSTDLEGGAAAIEASHISFEGCSFKQNWTAEGPAGALHVDASSAASIVACDFVENDAGLYNSGGGLVMERSEFSTPAVVTRCRFVGNGATTTGNGGGVCVYGTAPVPPWANHVVFRSCLFEGNTAYFSGGGLCLEHALVDIRNCTFHANSAISDSGGGLELLIDSTTVVIVSSSIFWGNTDAGGVGADSQIFDLGVDFECDASCIEGAAPDVLEAWGIGNTSVDPHFVDPIGPDGLAGTGDETLALSSDSASIDTGLADEASGTDLAGNPRWLDGDLDGYMQVDMGAYEYSNVSLEVADTGDALVVTVSGSQPLLAILVVGRNPGEKIVWPYGALLVDPTQAWSRYVLGMVPVQVSVPKALLAKLLGEASVTIQAIGVTTEGKTGNFSAAQEVSGGQ